MQGAETANWSGELGEHTEIGESDAVRRKLEGDRSMLRRCTAQRDAGAAIHEHQRIE